MTRFSLKSPFGGMTQWLYQRFTALFMIVYLAIIVFYLLFYSFSFKSWVALMSPLWMRLATSIFFILMIVHAWIGIQHVIDDYIKYNNLKAFTNLVFLFLTIVQLIYLPYFLMVVFNA